MTEEIQDDNIVAEYDPHNYNTQMESEVAWDLFTELLSQALDHVSQRHKHDDVFHVSASSVGWRNNSGERIFEVENGLELMNKIGPNTDYRVEVRRYTDSKLDIKIYHHDSPTGELYVVRPVYAKIAERFKSKGEKSALEAME